MKTQGFSGLSLPDAMALAACAGRPGGPQPAGEAASLAGVVHAERRRAHGLGREAARRALADLARCAPSDVDLRTAADGAPVSEAGHVSISHAGRGAGVVAVAAAFARPVGIDIERIAARHPGLHARLLGPAEAGVLEALGGPTDAAQTLLWALKEAVLKGQRTGFRAGARSVRLALEAGGVPPEAGRARAVSERSGAWEIAFARADAPAFGEGWLVVAWAA